MWILEKEKDGEICDTCYLIGDTCYLIGDTCYVLVNNLVTLVTGYTLSCVQQKMVP